MSTLKIYSRLEVKRLACNLPDKTPVEGDDDYKNLKRKLDDYFIPKKNKHHVRYTFNKKKARPGESVVSYTACLREKAKDCEFEDRINERILVHLIQTIKDNDLIKRSIQKKWDLDRFRKEASERDERYKKIRAERWERRREKRTQKTTKATTQQTEARIQERRRH